MTQDYEVGRSTYVRAQALRGQNVPGTHGTAGFATLDDLPDVLATPSGRDATSYVGHVAQTGPGAGKMLRLYPPHGAKLIFASPGSGKTTGVIIPALLTDPNPTVILDGKAESYTRAAGARAKLFGREAVLMTTVGKTAVYNPLLTVRVDRSRPEGGEFEERDAELLARASAEGVGGDNEVFEQWAVVLVSGVILYVCTADLSRNEQANLPGDPSSVKPRERSMAEVARLLLLGATQRKLLGHTMMRSSRPMVAEAGSMLLDASLGDGKLAMNIAMFARKNWAIFRSAEVRAMTYRESPAGDGEPDRNDVDFETFRGGKRDVYVVFPLIDTTRYASLLRILVGTVVDCLARNAGGPDDPVVNVHCDEFPQLKSVATIPDWILFLRGYRIALWFYVQNIGSLKTRYPDSWSSFEAVSTKIYFGVSDLETARHLSEYLGVTTAESRSYTVGGSETRTVGSSVSHTKTLMSGRNWGRQSGSGQQGESSGESEGSSLGDSWGTTESTATTGNFSETLAYVQRALMTPDEILGLPRHEMIMIIPSHRPIRGYLLPYYKWPDLNERSQTPPPQRLPFADFLPGGAA